jgi:zinc/manganese transport system substrate-binding protein
VLKSWTALLYSIALFSCAASPGWSAAARVKIVAAESVYADIAGQIGGDRVSVALMSRARGAVRPQASIVLLNGGKYDAWARDAQPKGKILEAAQFSVTGSDAGPYFWYDFEAMHGFADALAKELERLDPAGSSDYSRNFANFETSLTKLETKRDEVRKFYRVSKVLVTDNIYVQMIHDLDFSISDPNLAKETTNDLALANGGAVLKRAIAEKSASIFIYDSERRTPLLTKLAALANEGGVPAAGVRETKPASLTYQQWMLRELNSVHGALNEAAP